MSIKSLTKLQRLLINLFAILTIILSSGHFCSTFSHASTHHPKSSNTYADTVYGIQLGYKACCTNQISNDSLSADQQVQKIFHNKQNTTIANFSFLPISTLASKSASSGHTSITTTLDPGGGLPLRC